MTYVTLGLLIVCALTAAYFIWAIHSRIRLFDSIHASMKSDIAKLIEATRPCGTAARGRTRSTNPWWTASPSSTPEWDASKHALGYHDHNVLPDLSWRRRAKSTNTKTKRT